MKYFIFIVALTCFIQSNFAQSFDIVYFNDKWEITSEKFATYFRKSGFNNQLVSYDSVVTDYYINSKTEMTGFYENGLKEGDFVYYYPDGSIKLKSNYLHNNRNGTWTQYYINGLIMKEVQYIDNKEKLIKYNNEKGKNLIKRKRFKYKQIIYYDATNNTFNSEKPKEFFNKYTLQGKLINGFKDGLWKLTDSQWIAGNLKYRNGTFISGYIYNFKIEKDSINSDPFENLIFEPEKINITESFLREQGQLIKVNYVIKALLEEEKRNAKKAELNDEAELKEYFDRKYSYFVTNCSDTTTIKVALKISENGALNVLSFSTNTSNNAKKEAIRVFDTILKLKNHGNEYFTFNYRIMCLDELDYKK
jgi:antitoxin component YwqK of YwqJK toxin-antitoxin module